MVSIDKILEENGIDLVSPVNTLKSALNSCIVSICSHTASIGGWEMAHMYQETEGKSLFELQQLYKAKYDSLTELVSENIKDYSSIELEADKLQNELYYLSNKITKTMMGI